jgi:DNA mismatch repair protein MutS2
LSIAERLGLPADVLQEAREGIDPDRLAVESLISDLHRQREVAEAAGEAQRSAATEAETARARVTRELQSLEANRNRLIEQTRKEMESELQQTRSRLREAMKELERADRLTVFERAEAVEAVQEAIGETEHAVKQVQRRERKKRRGPLPPIEPGDRVFLQDVQTPGEAITAPDEAGEFDLMLGSLRARVNVNQVVEVRKDQGVPVYPEAERSPERPFSPPTVPPELDLRGMTVDEAVTLVDQRLDEASRAGVPVVRIIHGKGTGALRAAVRDLLRKHALVRAQEPAAAREGGDGVTVVEMAV